MPKTPEMPALARPLAVTIGDPAGIGLDILLTAWTDRERHPLPPLVLFGDPAAVSARAKILGITVDIAELSRPTASADLPARRLPVVPIPLAVEARPGSPESANAPAIIASIEQATAAVAAGDAAALVTNPIAKAVLYAGGFRHPGHTEFLAELAARHTPGSAYTPVMMLAGPELRVVPLTVHIPLAAVPAAISGALIVETVRITVHDLRRYFGIDRPRIAIAGLNPHAGEGGSIGREERDIIEPAIAELHAAGIDVRGPLSADTMFHPPARATYDAAVCMYHDQALIPLKTLAFDEGVNVTLGLPFVRTSPDHGTAFDIAGTGRASPTSFRAALHMAARMAAAATVTRL